MIRTRLAVAFALLALIALAQAIFAGWAASVAAHHAERSVVATKMLAEYLELSGNKQRLKVWFAQQMLAGDADEVTRNELIVSMRESLDALRSLVAQMPPGTDRSEGIDVETVALNIAALERAVTEAQRSGSDLTPAERWRSVIQDFDELAGRDMRGLLKDAIQRQEAASLRESAVLADALEQVRTANRLLALGVLLAAFAAVLYFVRRLDRPFARLVEQTSTLAAGDFSARSSMAGHDEFSRVGRLLDSMAERLADAQQRSTSVRQQLDDLVADRTRALMQAHESLLGIESRRRQFFAGLSHELRTPVTVIRGEADLALRNPGSAEDQRAALGRIVEAASELGARVQDLLEAARSGRVGYAYTLRRWPLIEVVRAAVDQMQAVAQHRGVTLHMDTTSPFAHCDVEIDRERFRQALAIVLDNALRYSAAGGRVDVAWVIDGDLAVVQVDDNGPGMDQDEIDKAFEPQFRGRAGRGLDPQGLGIGLAIARGILDGQRGSIELQALQPRGLRVSIALPLVSADEAGA